MATLAVAHEDQPYLWHKATGTVLKHRGAMWTDCGLMGYIGPLTTKPKFVRLISINSIESRMAYEYYCLDCFKPGEVGPVRRGRPSGYREKVP